MSLETISEHPSFGGKVGFYKHESAVNNCSMRFSVFVPAQAANNKVPVLTFLSGLTCTEETFMIKSGAQRVAAELGLMLVSPDTSPRGEGVPDDPDAAYDFGLGAGFYLNATQQPWRRHYHMYDYVTREMPDILFANFPGDRRRQGIFGHSMGGHGALTVGLKNREVFHSISAFAPICSPMNCPWGQKAFNNYLGDDRSAWTKYDATELARNIGNNKPRHSILIDQGLADQFLEQELHPHLLEAACKESGIALELRRHGGYDHGYYFISTFMEDHLRHHAAILKAQ
ncbi:MAG: S-formylglutathione hydrolase [Gammaproteobacteria bacterium]|nr:S-formylglutathione hydrolase [Gammaproteobacteria bacterium]MDH4316531.1 S-formylglutathione hydrolase [Gammaproteobacteria bacterium]MDH5215722.1 S-formylglutathione hydrolase [Gammaproteobacteria bacterium]